VAALAHTYLLTLSSFLVPVSLSSRTHSHDRAALDCLTFHLGSHGRHWRDSMATFFPMILSMLLRVMFKFSWRLDDP
jgi:hypothetical protein